MCIHVFRGLSALSKSSARRVYHLMTLIDELRSHSLEAGGATIPQGEMVARCWGTSQGENLILHAPGFGSAMDALRLTDYLYAGIDDRACCERVFEARLVCARLFTQHSFITLSPDLIIDLLLDGEPKCLFYSVWATPELWLGTRAKMGANQQVTTWTRA
ncbi:hypothetical protein DL93DRAFT_2100498 [Clavulina sp. PMI_390]|nr:hypothetical protein DL93DRAFT_2100498 [Clavulina sp. PMI_390]